MSEVEFIDIEWRQQPVSIEYQWVGAAHASVALIVFLHEGLGSRAMWKDFPERLCQSINCRGLVFSRPGYGDSTPRNSDDHWDVDFLHRQAFEVLPALLDELNINLTETPLWLFGHSDGGSIALLFASRYPLLAGIIVMSPHVFVEAISVDSIEQARDAYLNTDLKSKLARYHRDPDSAFWGWNDIWLHADFRSWSIEKDVEDISCPVLAVQGHDDEYGTLQQVYRIAQATSRATIVELEECWHSPHRDQTEEMIRISAQFVDNTRSVAG